MAIIRGFRELDVYKIGLEHARTVYEISRTFPPEERYSLTDQLRRSSRAVNAMIAEGWARRRYPASFVNKLNEAMGEAMETQAWLDRALACKYLSQTQHDQLDDAFQHIGAMLNRMIDRTSDFCRSESSTKVGNAT